MNKNIITQRDIDNLQGPGPNPKTLTQDPPAGFVAALASTAAPQAGTANSGGAPGTGGTGGTIASGKVPVPSSDDYLTKVLKYVPIEIIGAYLFIASIIDSNVTDKHDHAIWELCLLIGTLALAVPYEMRVLKVVRLSQVGISLLGITVYIFSLGGWFATTTWYHAFYASIAVAVFAVLVGILGLPPLPTETSSQPTGGTTPPGGQDDTVEPVGPGPENSAQGPSTDPSVVTQADGSPR